MTTTQLISANLAALAVGIFLGYAIVNDGLYTRQVVFFPTGGNLENGMGMRCNCSRSTSGSNRKWVGKSISTTSSCNQPKGKPYNYYTTSDPTDAEPHNLNVPANSCCQQTPKIGSEVYDSNLGLC